MVTPAAVQTTKPRVRLYVDETGDHSDCMEEHCDNVGKRYLGLVGVAINADENRRFAVALNELKRRHFAPDPDEPPLVLHRKEISQAANRFSVLADEKRRMAFDRDLLELVEQTKFMVITVVIDKLDHARKTWRRTVHPYHYAVQVLLERFCGALDFWKHRGDVVAESRGGKENNALKDVFRRFCADGTRYCRTDQIRRTLETTELKVKPKEANVAGLQLADILAHPSTRDVLIENGRLAAHGGAFAAELCRRIEPKYNRHVYKKQIRGYGRILLT